MIVHGCCWSTSFDRPLLTYGMDGRLVEQIGQVGNRETGSAQRRHPQIDIRTQVLDGRRLRAASRSAAGQAVLKRGGTVSTR
jgi:hypothetical protein